LQRRDGAYVATGVENIEYHIQLIALNAEVEVDVVIAEVEVGVVVDVEKRLYTDQSHPKA
jgi:tetrahydromethanopterin S-methyltransferase subunit F